MESVLTRTENFTALSCAWVMAKKNSANAVMNILFMIIIRFC